MGTDDGRFAILAIELLFEAVRRQATDLHIDPGVATVLIEYRVSGERQPYMELPAAAAKVLAARLKLAAWLDITNTGVAQEGTISPQREGCHGLPAAQVHTEPTPYGERINVHFQQL